MSYSKTSTAKNSHEVLEQNSREVNRFKTAKELKYWMLFGLLISLVLHGFLHINPGSKLLLLLNQKAVAQSSTSIIPTKSFNDAPVPDWEHIAFKSFVFNSNGSIELPKSETPGYKSRRVWQAGQSLDRVMELGDFEKVLGLENFSLKDIESKSGTSLQNINLSDFSLAKWQTVPELVKAIPNLAKLQVLDVPPIKDLIEQKLGIGVAGQTVGELIEQNPELKNIELGEIDLSKYSLRAIPGIDNAQLKDFSNWQNATISKVPGLNQVSFNNLPNAIASQGNVVAQVDLPLREVENNRQRSISGSYQEGFNVPCSTKCAHIELAGSNGITGAQWISGKFQEVKGGYGILGSLNGGKEPTGRHPFGKAFKQVIWSVDEASGSITTAIFFRICKHDLGCSPYYIGPFDYATYKEKSAIFLGSL
ncbi:MAG: hypothetical protein PUP93_29665 [Rhizonema sp. NSF051]|nr:hypothetical protein [Rhizonema sp. NSF051]